MSIAARIAFLVFGFTICGWLFWLSARSQRVLDHAEGAVDTADRLLWVLERRLATRGVLAWLGDDAPISSLPVGKLTGGTLTADLVAAQAVTEETIAGIVGATVERMSTAPQPATTPATVPTNQAIDAWHRALAQRSLLPPSAAPDDVDERLTQFRFNPGHTRGHRRQKIGDGEVHVADEAVTEVQASDA